MMSHMVKGPIPANFPGPQNPVGGPAYDDEHDKRQSFKFASTQQVIIAILGQYYNSKEWKTSCKQER